MAFALAKWAVYASAVGTAGCGVSATQPISAIVGATVDEGGTDATSASDSPDSDPLTRGLVAYWKLDENGPNDEIIDSSGHGHHGVPIGGPNPTTAHPPVHFDDPGSRMFDGAGQYVLIADSPELSFSGEITLAAWVNLASTSDGCHYIVGHGYCQAPSGEVDLRVGSDGCGPGGSPHNWVAGAYVKGGEYSAVAPISDLDIQMWLHIAGVFDGRAWILYKNGAEIARMDTTVGALSVQAQWAIGAAVPGLAPCPAGAARFFHGSIDDVRIYNRALSPSEMLELYHR